MDAKAILDNLLNTSQHAAGSGIDSAKRVAANVASNGNQKAVLSGLGAAGAVALLFGSKGTRKFAKKAAMLGGTAAVGGLAYKAFSDWQAQSSAQQQFDTGTPIDALPTLEAKKRSEAIVQAMIGGARADGHIDELEQARITTQIESAGLEQDVTQFLLAEIGKPLDPKRIAALADCPEAAAEMYLVSAMFVDNSVAEERRYLNELADAMGLSAELVQSLEGQLQVERVAS